MKIFNFICVTTDEGSSDFIESMIAIDSILTNDDIVKRKYIYSMGSGGAGIEEDQRIIRNSNFVGLSIARNELIKKVNEGYLIFCDDDAIYEKDFLINLSEKIDCVDFNTGYIIKLLNKENNFAYGNRKYPLSEKLLSKREVIKIGISLNIILNLNMIKNVGLFNEKLGVGSPGLAGEETDIILRLLDKNISFKYLNGITARHPSQNTKDTSYLKIYQYALGYRKMIDASKVNINLKIICYFLIMEMIVMNIIAIIVDIRQTKVRLMRIKGLLLL